MRFWLGAHMPQWLDGRAGDVMMSARRLESMKTLPQAGCDWVLDSGGFTELSLFGSWDRVPAPVHAAKTRRFHDEIGRLQWAAPQDWMCEPFMLAKTGKPVPEHQRLTTRNLLDLRTLWPDGPFIPVLQGYAPDDYWRHVDQYAAHGIDLTAEPLVGIGSVCRRQATDEIAQLVAALSGAGIRLHGFGCKTEAVRRYGVYLASADSMAWSFNGRKVRPCPVRGVASCANCLHHALAWRDRITVGAEPVQMCLAVSP